MPALPEPLADEAVLVRKPGLAVVRGDRRTVVLDLDRPAEPPVVLADSGRAIWDAVAERSSVADVVGAVADGYGEDAAVVGPPVRSFLAELVERGLLVVS